MDSMIIKDEDSHHHQPDYANNPWAEMTEYHSPHAQSPATEFHAYGFMPAQQQNVLERSYDRPMHGLYSAAQPSQPMFTAQWPSMLTNPSPPAPGPAPMPAPPPPTSTYTTAPSLPPLTTTHKDPNTSSRRTLTDQDRRRMCQYHEDHPNVKQTEIGAMFGVERSTVSKVLRQKDKYLFPDDGSRSPIKKSKGKFPDIERALSNWARNHQRSGLPLSDSIIREKARFFATTVGSSDCHAKVNSNSWLEKFKQKNQLMGAKPRKPSDAHSDLGLDTAPPSGNQTPNGISPISPAGLASVSPISGTQGREIVKTESPDSYGDFSSLYKHTHTQSATSLASGYTDLTAPSPFSPQSPTSPFFSSDVNASGVLVNSESSKSIPSSATDSVRRRSQTFPMLGAEAFSSMDQSGETLHQAQVQEMMSASAIDTANNEHTVRNLSISSSDLHALSSHPASDIHSSLQGSPAIMAPPPNPLTNSSNHQNTTPSPVSLPSQEEARRALELVMSFFQSQPNGVVDPQEYIMMGKLMEKLKVQGPMGELPGGMHSINMSQKEMSRKRSIHSL